MSGSYQFENLEGRHAEAALLAERAQMRLEGFVPLVLRHGFTGKGRILDVGTGQGIRARALAEGFPDAEVLGLDRSRELLASARAANSGVPNLRFREADLYALPFAPASFDFIYARLVFMHLHDPATALAGLRRVLKPGGRILLEDADRDCMFFEPAPASFRTFWEKVQAGQRRLGGDPNVGRKLASHLRGQGFVDVRPEAQPLLGGGSEIAFLVRTLMPSLNLYLEPADRAAGAAAIGDLASLARDPRAAFHHFWFIASGARP